MAVPPLSLLFDLDGTVVDSEPGILASCRAALRSLRHRPDDLDIGKLIGPPLEEVLAGLLSRFGDDRVAEAALAYRNHYGSCGFRETTVYPGLAAALEELAAWKAKLYIATSKRTVFAKRILTHLGLSGLFAGVQGCEPDETFDSKANVIAEVLRRHELSADRCLMVGDRGLDVEGARANGVSAVGVLWGYGDWEELKAAGVMHLAARPAELAPIAKAHARRLGGS